MEEIDFNFYIDFRSGATISEQIFNKLRGVIERRALRPGTRLPPVRELAAKLQVNFNTVARVYRQLDQLGMISTQQGRGTYILQKDSEIAAPAQDSTTNFLAQLDEFIMETAQKYGKTRDTLWEIALSHYPSPRSIAKPGRTNKKKKNNCKPGWKKSSSGQRVQNRGHSPWKRLHFHNRMNK